MNIIGMKFGKLTVIEKTNEKAKNNGEFKYRCKCDCGNEVLVRGSHLKDGNSQTCGCSHRLTKRKENIRIYNIYQNMKERCYNKNCKSFKNYGKRGIKICEEWLNDYNCFYEWAIKNGYKDELSIDRINVDGNYEPNNCRWATRIQQANNTTQNVFITYHNEKKTVAEWARTLNMSYSKLNYRLKNWDIEKAFNK